MRKRVMTPKEIPSLFNVASRLALDDERVIALNCEVILGPSGPMPLADVTHMRLADLTAEVLLALEPSVIILPLFAADFDATTAIETLLDLGFAGRVTVLAPALPKPRLVERELRSLGLQVTLISP